MKRIGVVSFILMTLIALILSACEAATEPEEGYYPTNLQIEKTANSRIKLTWDYHETYGDTITFQIDRKIGPSDWEEQYAFTDAENMLLIDYISTNDTQIYAYRVKSYNVMTGEESPYSEVVAYLSEYTYPTNLQFTQTNQDDVTITWEDNCIGEEGYIVDKRIDLGDWEEDYLILPPDAVEITDEVNLFENNIYRIYAYIGVTKTPFLSDTLFATLMPPSNLNAAMLDETKIRINWQDNSDLEDGFFIDRKVGELDWVVNYAAVTSEDTTYVDDITLECATINYRVRAYKAEYTSNYSESCSINILLELIGEYSTSGTALDVYLPVENPFIPEWTAFISQNYEGLSIVTCLNPTSPVEMNTIQDLWGDRTLTCFVSGSFAYVATQRLVTAAGGIQKLDISNISAPNVYNVTETQGIPKDIYVDGDFAYIAEGDAGLSVMYIAGSTPNIFSYYDLEDARSVEMIHRDGFKYAVLAQGLNNGITILDVTDPNNIALTANLTLDGVACEVDIIDNYVFLANGEEGLQIIDITDINNPFALKTINTGGFINGVSAEENRVYLSDLENGVFVIDTTDPVNSYILGNLNMDTQPLTIQLAGSYVYVTDSVNLKIIKIKP